MKLQFDKLHGLGNDFVFLNFEIMPSELELSPALFKFLGDRKRGIGCDLTVVYDILPNNFVKAKFFNQDGSVAEICGNACRCLGLLLQKFHGISKFKIFSNFRTYHVESNRDFVKVEMGVPSFDHSLIGIDDKKIDVLQMKNYLDLPECISDACAISIGNPHLILFTNEQLSVDDMQNLGAKLEKHSMFRNRINVSFARVLNDNQIQLTVFERGVGLTLACGSGACATSFASFKFGKTASNVTVLQNGGNLDIHIDDNNSVIQKGSATYVFHGEIELCL